jgi:predicted RNase H-like HicB family nuclease
MKHIRQLSAIIEREGSGYVGLCPELDMASQRDTIESARSNLQEVVELFFERRTQPKSNDGVLSAPAPGTENRN